MLKLSMIESPRRRRLVLEGALIAPWADEFNSACKTAQTDLDGRELVVELKNLIVISQEGEDVLLALMDSGIKLRSHGIFTRLVLRRIARKMRRKLQETKP
jgi:hypothetical protein